MVQLKTSLLPVCSRNGPTGHHAAMKSGRQKGSPRDYEGAVGKASPLQQPSGAGGWPPPVHQTRCEKAQVETSAALVHKRALRLATTCFVSGGYAETHAKA